MIAAQRENFLEAERLISQALIIIPDFPEALNNRGIALNELKRPEEAVASFDRALTLKPDYAEAFYNRGNALMALMRLDAAVASYDEAIGLRPSYVKAINNRGNALTELKRPEDALKSYDMALALMPDYADALANRANALSELGRIEEAIVGYDRAIALKPGFDTALAEAVHLRQQTCDWRRYDEDRAQLTDILRRGGRVQPFMLRTADVGPEEQLACAKHWAEIERVPPEARFQNRPDHSGKRIRLGYLSSDFRQHAVAYLLAELIERHDRSRFEVIGYSLGPDDASDLRQRLRVGFDRFVDLGPLDDAQAARRIHEDGIDVLVDLNGFTRGGRRGILGRRPAPIQASWLGYLGTMGSAAFDYVIADPFSVPLDRQPFYVERIVHLPQSYLPVDTTRLPAEAIPSRRDYGLPEEGFVFCCLNTAYKLTPAIFDIWMRLLRAVPGSALWLYRSNELVVENLRREAALRRVDPDRLVFTGRVPALEHLGRFRRADLFLDTQPCSACTMASDALWTGLPVLAMAGKTYAGRHAGSLLRAIGLPELIADTPEDYEAIALKLATDRQALNSIKNKLDMARRNSPTFDMTYFARSIEAAYHRMHEIRLAGGKPVPFAVEAPP